jgi:hypothetical protein
MEASKHAAERVAAEGLPEEASQLRVSVRNVDPTDVLLPASHLIESPDDLPECEQTLIDLDTLLLSLPRHLCVALPL